MSETDLREAQAPWAEAITIGDLLIKAAASWPGDTALVFPDRRCSYRQVADGAIAVARSLAALGIGRGDAVGILMPNTVEAVLGLFATQLLGAVAVPVNTRFRSRELAHVVDHAGLKVLMTYDLATPEVDYVGRLYETFPELEGADDPLSLALPGAPSLRAVVQLGGADRPGLVGPSAFAGLAETVTFEEIHERRRRVRVRDVALMLFTSGTTAMPKGCLLTHEAVVRNWIAVGHRLGIRRSEIVFDPLPLFHMSGIGPLLFTVANGATIVNMLHFYPGPALDLIEQERVTWIYTMFPPVTMGLIADPSFASRNLSSVRALMNVAPAETLEVIGNAFAGTVHLQGPFGMTEAGGAITCQSIEAAVEDRLTTTGAPLPGVEVKVIDPDTGHDMPPGSRGELLIRGFGLFEGYFKDPDSTAAAVDADGWLHSGDLGEIDERGWVIYLGRLKEMLKVGGENVAPSEIEAHISTHSAVKLVQVVGIPDERLDEVPVAFVELVPGATLAAGDVIGYCEGKIAGFKVPRHVRFVTDWPMSATKVQKSRLQEQIAAELGIELRR